jgi:ERCC4-related helicase
VCTRTCAQEVINKLGITQLEFRAEAARDVAPYCHERETEVRGVWVIIIIIIIFTLPAQAGLWAA